MSYGYCLTLYKAQGSEWQSVLVNLRSLLYSVKDNNLLLKATYTAITRAKSNIKLFY